MALSPLIRRYPDVDTLDLEFDMAREEVFRQLEPYLNWRLFELETSFDAILIYAPPSAEDSPMLLLTGNAAHVWLLHYLAR